MRVIAHACQDSTKRLIHDIADAAVMSPSCSDICQVALDNLLLDNTG